MPAQSPLSLMDGQATPVAHVFAPKGARMQGGRNVANWRDGTQASMLAKWTVDETYTPADGKAPEKFRYVLRLPTVVTDSTTGVTSSPHFAQAEIQVFLPLDCTPAEVNNLHGIVKSFAASAYFQDAIRNRESAW